MALENANTLARRGLLRGWASEPRPPNDHRRLRGLPLVCAGQRLPVLVTVAASDPILLAGAHGGSRWRPDRMPARPQLETAFPTGRRLDRSSKRRSRPDAGSA